MVQVGAWKLCEFMAEAKFSDVKTTFKAIYAALGVLTPPEDGQVSIPHPCEFFPNGFVVRTYAAGVQLKCGVIGTGSWMMLTWTPESEKTAEIVMGEVDMAVMED